MHSSLVTWQHVSGPKITRTVHALHRIIFNQNTSLFTRGQTVLRFKLRQKDIMSTLPNLMATFFWDSPGSGNCDPDCPCWDDWDEDDDEPKWRRKPKKKLPKTLCSHHQHKPPYNPPPPPAPLPIYQKELKWIAKNYKTDILSNIQHSTPPI